MIRLEYNTNNEWLQVFSAVDFSGIDECDQDYAADDFTDRLVNQLETAGFDCHRAKGQRMTCHGWNGANTFKHKLGPVGTFDDLSQNQINEIFHHIHAAELAMRKEWVCENA